MKKFVKAGLAVAATSALLLSACTMVDVTYVSEVDGEKVYLSTFEYMLAAEQSNVAYELQAIEGGMNEDGTLNWDVEIDGVKASDKARQNALDAAIDLEVQVQKAKELGLEPTEDEIKALEDDKAMIIDYYMQGDKALFLQQLDAMGVTESEYDKIQLDSLYASKVREHVAADLETTDEELVAELNNSYYRAKHILIKDPSSTAVQNEDGTTTEPQYTAEEAQEIAKQRAEAVKARLAAGEDFDAVMNEVSEDGRDAETNELTSKDGYLFQDNGQMIQVFVDTTKTLEIGQVSDLVRVDDYYQGYHIIKRVDFLEEDKEQAKATLQQQKYDDLVDSWKAEKTIETKENLVKKAKVE